MNWKRFGLIMVEIIKVMFILSLIIGSFYFVALENLYDHELIHKKIFDTYGIENNLSINYRTLGGNVTVENYEDCNDACLTQNRFNDIINYNVTTIIHTFFLLFVCGMIIKLFYD